MALDLAYYAAKVRFENQALVCCADPTFSGSYPGMLPAFTPSLPDQHDLRGRLTRVAQHRIVRVGAYPRTRARWVLRDPWSDQVPQEVANLTPADLTPTLLGSGMPAPRVWVRPRMVGFPAASGSTIWRWDLSGLVFGWCTRQAARRRVDDVARRIWRRQGLPPGQQE